MQSNEITYPMVYVANPEKYTHDRNKEIGMSAFRRRIYFLSDHRAFAIGKHRVAN